MQASRKTHQEEINAKISYKLSNKTEEERKISQEKRQITCFERYGDKNYHNKEKAKQTMLELYGGTATLNSNLKQKVQQTNLQKFGGVSPMCSNIIVDKVKETYIQNNGGMGFESVSVKETFKKNYKAKYGVEYSSQNPIVRRKQATKYKYDDVNFDSKPEIAYYIWLKDNNIDFEYQPNVKFVYFYQNKIHYYIPDFKVGGEYVEIKGIHFFKNHNVNETMINPFDRTQDDKYEAKHQCMIKNNVKILTNFDEYIKYVKNKYGNTFLESLKRK